MYYVIFDVGGTFVKYAVMDRSGDIMFKGKCKTPKSSYEHLLANIYRVIDAVNQDQIRGISLCFPGVIDSDRGIIYYGGSLPYLHEQKIKQTLQERYPKVLISIENDDKASALAELWQGSVRNHKNVIILVLGTAIGGGIIINGELYRGDNYSAGEVSYMVGEMKKQANIYERMGFEASASKMIEDIAQVNGLPANTAGEIVFEYITPDNEKSWAIFTAYCRKVAKMIVTLQYILDPHHFIISGGISVQAIVVEQIMNEINTMYAANPNYSLYPRIEQSTLNNDANLYGAFYHLILEHSETMDHGDTFIYESFIDEGVVDLEATHGD